MGQRTSDGWKGRVGTRVGPLGARVGPPPSLWERYGTYGLIVVLSAVLVLIGLTILAHVEDWLR